MHYQLFIFVIYNVSKLCTDLYDRYIYSSYVTLGDLSFSFFLPPLFFYVNRQHRRKANWGGGNITHLFQFQQCQCLKEITCQAVGFRTVYFLSLSLSSVCFQNINGWKSNMSIQIWLMSNLCWCQKKKKKKTFVWVLSNKNKFMNFIFFSRFL